MSRRLLLLIIMLIANLGFSQTFSYSGYIYNANSVGAANVAVKLYKRTTPTLTGFTSQTNYNGHSYYRSTGTAYWSDAKTACESMNGHLVTISNSAENSFVYNTWPSGWIGYYQDKTGAFYGEPNAGWRWTENYVTTNQQADYDVASYTSGTSLVDIKNSLNASLYNSPTYTSTGGKYLTFNGSTQYGITGNLTSKLPSKTITLLAWVYPTNNGVILSELGVNSTSSGWHESVFEITGSNTLRVGLWSGSGIVQVSTSITLNAWHLVGLTYDGTTMVGYKDGASFGSTSFTREAPHIGNGGNEYFAFGLGDATNMGSGAYGAYRLGDFQVYSSALTSDEMNRNYMSTAWRFGVYPYSNWNGGEPNNSGGEDFIQFVGSGLWNDLPNNYALNYVLEFDYILTTSAWSLYKTVYTNSSGYYSFSEATNPSVEWYIQIDSPITTTTLQNSDGQAVSSKAISRTYTSLDYYKYDVNNDGNITVSDEYYVFMKKSGRFSTWNALLPNVRLFTSAQFSIINSSTTDLRSTYPGVSSITINSPVSGGSSNYYIINTGYSNSTVLGY